MFFRKRWLGKRDANTYERKVRSGNWAFFYVFSTRNHSRENSPNSISSIVLFLHLVVKPLGMNVIIFPLIFIPKSRSCVLHTNLNHNRTPVITIIGVPCTVLTLGVFRKFKQGRFWAPHINRKWAFFSFNMLDATKFILLSVFTLKEMICPKICSKSRHKSAKGSVPVDVRRSKTSLLKVLPKIMTENGIYSPPMKVISNTIFFVYYLRGALIKIARGYHTRWRNYFDGTNPIIGKIRRYPVAFSYPDYSKRIRNWHT